MKFLPGEVYGCQKVDALVALSIQPVAVIASINLFVSNSADMSLTTETWELFNWSLDVRVVSMATRPRHGEFITSGKFWGGGRSNVGG